MARVVPAEAVAAHEVLRSVRNAIAELPGGTLLVACSGGPDSLALAAATADVASANGRTAGALIVDHGLQDGSADVAETAARQCSELGLSPVTVVRVDITPGAHGPEAAARSARYEALESGAREIGAVAVLLGHSMDDQAETVLLGLARGSGTRSLAGMRPTRGILVRPLLGIRRDTLREACDHWGLRPWIDPHNSDPAFTRVRVRAEVIPILESQLGPGVVSALVRTARMARADSDALDQWALEEWERSQARSSDQTGGQHEIATGLGVSELARLPFAIRTRVLRLWLVAEGCPASGLTAEHVWSVARLVDQWRGQGKLSVPGRMAVWRECDTLLTGPDGPRSLSRGDRDRGPESEAGRPEVECSGSADGSEPSGYKNGESEEL